MDSNTGGNGRNIRILSDISRGSQAYSGADDRRRAVLGDLSLFEQCPTAVFISGDICYFIFDRGIRRDHGTLESCANDRVFYSKLHPTHPRRQSLLYADRTHRRGLCLSIKKRSSIGALYPWNCIRAGSGHGAGSYAETITGKAIIQKGQPKMGCPFSLSLVKYRYSYFL